MDYSLGTRQAHARDAAASSGQGEMAFRDHRPATAENVRLRAMTDASPRHDSVRAIKQLVSRSPAACARGTVQRAVIEVDDSGLFDDGRRARCANAVDGASALIDGALQDLADIENDNDEAGHFARFFGGGDLAAGLATVTGVYTAAHTALGTVRIVDHVNGMEVQANEGTHAWSTFGGAINLCETFWRSGAATMALTLLHESTHVARDTGDDTGIGIANAVTRAADDPAAARNCAYNYEYFAQEGEARYVAQQEEEDEEEEGEQDEDGEDEAQHEEAIDLRQVVHDEEVDFAARLNALSLDYNLSVDPRQRQRLAARWGQIERTLFHRWGMNGRLYTLWLSLSRIGEQVKVDR